MDQSLPQLPLVETYDEFDDAAEMPYIFCRQLTTEEIEKQSERATHQGIDELINYLENNPEEYAKIIRKRKVEDLENGGIFSYLKLKMMNVYHGGQYSSCLVTPEETCSQLNDLKRGMTRAFQYSQDSKGRRFSSRLAQKRKRNENQITDENQPPRRFREKLLSSRLHHRVASSTTLDGSPNLIPVAKVAPNDSSTVPPPPPPPPLLPVTPRLQLQRQPLHKKDVSPTEGDHEFLTPKSRRKKHKRTQSTGSNSSMTSLTSIHSELMSSNPLTRLRSTDVTRSPGGTPIRPRSEKFTPSEPLHKALMIIMRKKFRNVRTPSPKSANQSRNCSQNNSASFSPSVCLSP